MRSIDFPPFSVDIFLFSVDTFSFHFPIRFYDKRDAEDALEAMDGRMLDGRELRVQMARYGRPTSPQTRRNGGRDRGRDRRRWVENEQKKDKKQKTISIWSVVVVVLDLVIVVAVAHVAVPAAAADHSRAKVSRPVADQPVQCIKKHRSAGVEAKDVASVAVLHEATAEINDSFW